MAPAVAPPVPDDTDGLIWVSYPYGDGMVATVALVVADGRVVGSPPFSWSWAMGGDARAVWDRAVERGRKLSERTGVDTWIRWVPDRPKVP